MIGLTLLAALTIAFPKAGQRFPYLERCYLSGAVPAGETNLVIRGRNVAVHPSGAWVTLLDCVEGTNVVEVAGSNHWFVVGRKPKPPTTTNVAPPRVYKKLPYASDTPKPHPSSLIPHPSSLIPHPSTLTIVLDAGHGGDDTGAVSPHGWPEKEVNLLMAKAVRSELEAMGCKVVMTREDDTFVPLYDRPKVAHAHDAAAFVSIHHNAPPHDRDPMRFRYHAVYSWNEIGKRLGAAINRRMASVLGESLVNNGLPHANFAVTRNPEIPSCLIEVDFVTTPESEADCWNPERRLKIAKAIAQGIADWCVTPPPEAKDAAATVAVRGEAASAAKIVVRQDATASERHAAAEFADYVKRQTGVAPEIADDAAPLPARAVLIGKTRYTAEVLGGEPDWTKLGDDGFRVAVRGGRLVIAGSGVRGALYGAYDVLERFGGVDWLAAKRTVVPRLDRFAVPAGTDYTETPAFRMRDIYWWDAVHDRDFAAHRRLNGQRTHLDEERGGTLGKFDAKLGSCHTFGRLVPVDEFFKDHPEYFSEVKGKRESNRTQLCLTNPDVLRIVTERVLARIRESPTADFYGVSQNDWANFCTCEKCRAVDEAEGSHSGTIIRFVNAVAEAVEREFPGKMIETLAYTYGKQPPKLTKPRSNVLVCLCSDNVDHWTPLTATNHAVNVAFAGMLRGWGELTRNIYIWDYTTDFAHYLNAMPNGRVLAPNLRFFRDCGVDFMFEQGDALGRHGDFAELKSYLLSKFMWNPDLDEEKVLDRFFRGYYGAGAPFARQYFDEVHALPHARVLGMYEFPDANWRSDEFLAKADELWRRAVEATADDPEANYACRMGRAGVVYTILWRARNRFPLVWCTRNPEAFRGRAEEMKPMREFFLQCQQDGAPLRLVENVLRNETMNRRFRRLTTVEVPKSVTDKVVFESDILDQPHEWWGGNGRSRREKDRQASGGDAMWLNPKTKGDALNLYFDRQVVCDPDVTYRLRVRAKAVAKADAAPDAELFRVSIYNDIRKNHVKPPRNCLVREVKDEGYAWYDVLDWVPKAGDRLVVQPGRFQGEPAAEGVWVDAFELSRVEK